MSLTFRNGRDDDVPAVARLGAHSFPGVGLSLDQWEESFRSSPRGGIETLWVGEEDGSIVAAARLYRFEQWIAGTRVPMMGLGTVAIAPTHRRRGIAGKLVATSLEHARARGDIVSALFPFRTSFYRKLGYGTAGDALQYRIPPAALPDHELRHRVEIVDTAERRREVAGIYDLWASTQTGQLVREGRAWEPIWMDGSRHGVLYRNAGGQATGYAVFAYLPDVARGGRAVDVEEVAWLEPEAKLAIYGWLSSLSDQWDFVHYRAHPDEGFAEHLSELRHPVEGFHRWHLWFAGGTVLQGPMFRILDIEAAWRARSIDSDGALNVALEVHDDQLPENTGTWALRLESGSVHPIKGHTESADLRLALSIELLSRFYIGAISPTAAVRAGLLQTESAEALELFERLIRVPRPWTFDRF